MRKRYCVLGCPPGETLYSFPCKVKDKERRNKWLDFFVIETPKKWLYACGRHFSSNQKKGVKMRQDAVPDIPICSESAYPAVLQKELAIIHTVACTQTNTRLCGSVQVSEFMDEYRLNCFYCSDTFPLEKWSEFVDHLQKQHYEKEQAFKIINYPYDDHGYTTFPSISSPEPVASNSKTYSIKLEPMESEDNPQTGEDPLAINDKISIAEVNELKENITIKSISSPEIVKRNRIKNTIIPTPGINRSSTKGLTIRSTPMRIKRFINVSTKEISPTSPVDSVSNDNVATSFEPDQTATKKECEKPLEKQTSSKTDLNKCLTRANSETTQFLSDTSNLNPKELFFQFTPRGIMMDLLDNIKDYPILWKFHAEPYNEDYDNAIQKLCMKLNDKWYLNLTALQMRSSINRILTYYRYMLPLEKVVMFPEYFEKCSEFLPLCDDDIPRRRCEYCDICYANDSEMKKHLVEEHRYLKFPYKCEHCSERFMEYDDYELHKHLPHFMELFRCQHCNKRFNHRHVLKRHLKLHEPPAPKALLKMHKCDKCDKEFKNTSELASHSVYHEEKSFQCHLCPKSFYRKLNLTYHIKNHFNQLDFICEICGKAFLQQKQLNDHMDKHTGAKVTCNICNLKLRKCSLSRHLRVVHVAYEGTIESTFRAKCYHYRKHTQPNRLRAYKANNIIKEGLRKNDIKKNKEDGLRKYDCKKCKIHFDRLKLLKDHNSEVHCNVKMVTCKICNTEFKHKPNLKRHYRNVHNLHKLQVVKLLHHNEDLNKVLNLKIEDLPEMTELEYCSNLNNPNFFADEHHLEEEEDANCPSVDDDSVNMFLIDL